MNEFFSFLLQVNNADLDMSIEEISNDETFPPNLPKLNKENESTTFNDPDEIIMSDEDYARLKLTKHSLNKCRLCHDEYCMPLLLHQQITENFDNIDDYFGLVHCKILPPKNHDIALDFLY